MTEALPLAVSMGDPAGIGIEITAKAWRDREHRNLPAFFLIGKKSLIEASLSLLGSAIPTRQIERPEDTANLFATHLPIYDPGEDGNNAHQTLCAIRTGVIFCQQGKASALVTNPIQKKRLYDAGFTHPGHTEYLAALTSAPGKAVMMFSCKELKVVPATIHIPLSEVPAQLSEQLLEHVIRTTHQDLEKRFGKPNPRIVVAGLNPHAGEEGSIGREDTDLIAPLVQALSADGMDINGPYPADSLFHAAAREKYDAAICMYHDQALIPIKTIDFENGVNVTLGLPIIRTSPDHGTAEDIAGKDIANPASLIAAILTAEEMARNSEARL